MGLKISKDFNAGQKGFTLIETVLALSITAIAVALVYSALGLGVKAWERGEQELDEGASLRSFAARFSTEAGSMRVYNRDGAYLFEGTSDTLGFVTVSAPGGMSMPWGGARWVRYARSEEGLVIHEKGLPSPELEAQGTVKMGFISRVAFQYLGDEGWIEGWDNGERLPRAVKAVVSFKSGKPDLTITVPVGAGSGRDGSGI